MPSKDALCWDDLRYVEALDRLGTAGRVARELRVSVSTVYRRIAALESAIGVRCLAHGTGRLTEAGLVLADAGRRTATSLAEIQQTVRVVHRAVQGDVSLTTVEGFVGILAPVLAEVARRHPQLRVTLQVADQGPSVRHREVDIAIAVVPKPPQGLWGRRLFTIHYGAFGTPAAVGALPPRWIVADRTPAHAAWEAENATHQVLRTNSLGAAIAFARLGMGLAILPKRLAATEPSLVEAGAFSTSLERLERPAWLVTHPDLREVPRVRAVMDAIAEGVR